jgi:hypothetical protein
MVDSMEVGVPVTTTVQRFRGRVSQELVEGLLIFVLQKERFQLD